MNRNIIQPVIFASGVSLFLFTHNNNLSIPSYLAPFPFWIAIGRPLGLFWNQKVLKQLNKDVFPAQMRNYRQLYLVSQRALAYDIIFNHCIFNPLQALIVIGYTYTARKIEDAVNEDKTQRPTMLQVLKQTGLSLVQIRALVSVASILSEYWISYFSIKKVKGAAEGMSMNNSGKRLLLMK